MTQTQTVREPRTETVTMQWAAQMPPLRGRRRMQGVKGPCMDCEQRHQACWDSCERYGEWAKKRRNAAEALRMERDVDNYKIERMLKHQKKVQHDKRK